MASVQTWMQPYLRGKCYDFALALSLQVKRPQFVAVAKSAERSSIGYEHVGLRLAPGVYADVRGVLGEEEFLGHHRERGCSVFEVDRSEIELHAGVSGMGMPYSRSEDVRRAVFVVHRLAFPKGLAHALEAYKAAGQSLTDAAPEMSSNEGPSP